MTRLLIVIGFVIWFGAGLAVGWRVASPKDQPQHPPRPGAGSWLAQQLNLTPDQQKQLDAIWSPLGRGGPSNRDTRSQYRRDREAAIAALIPEDQKPAYQKIIEDYAAKTAALESQWKQSFAQAVAKTKAILTPQQRVKYEELMAKAHREPDGRDRNRPPHAPPPPEGTPPEGAPPQGPPAESSESSQPPHSPQP